MKRIAFFYFVLFFCSAIFAAEPVKYAVLVGVDDYEKMRKLRYATNDIEALRDQLYKIGFKKENVFCLTTGGVSNARPTKERIEKTLQLATDLAEEGDFLFLAMAGHGIETSEGQARFCPVEASTQNLLSTTLPISDIFEDIGRCKATYKLMLIDACRDDPFQGRSALGARSLQQTLDDPPKGCLLLQSCARGEMSLEDDSNVDVGADRRERHNQFGSPVDRDIPLLRQSAQRLMKGNPVAFNAAHAESLWEQWIETATIRCWQWIGVAVMFNHVHCLLEVADADNPDKVLGDLKSFGSLKLNRRYGKPISGTWWTTGGSKRRKDSEAIPQLIRYLRGQPNPLLLWINHDYE